MKINKKKKGEKQNRKEKQSRKEKAKISIKLEILIMTLIPLAIMTVIVAIYSLQSMKDTLAEEALNGLKDLCYSVKGTYDTLDHGKYEMNGNYLKKGEYQVTQNEKMLENFVAESDVEISLYFGDAVAATSMTSHQTGKKIRGDKISEKVYKEVVENKEEYSETKALINEWYYYAYYIPLKNPGGDVVGIIFAGKPCKDIDDMIQERTIGILILAVIILAVAAVAVFLISNRLGRAVSRAGVLLGGVSQGDMTLSIDKRMSSRGDEVGLMARALSNLIKELNHVIQNVKESSEVLAEAGLDLKNFSTNTRTNTDEITQTVGDIAKGVMSQAEDTEKAISQVDVMGGTIDQIISGVKTLNQTSQNMELSKNDAEAIIEELSKSSERTYEAVKSIEQQVNLTDDSVSKIQQSVTLISSIAEETNLLSLNASIEAARAGEAGKGFAVVASEIQKLAEESNASAAKIEEVIQILAGESRNTVVAMEHMHEIIDEQQVKLQETKMKFQDVSNGIQSSMGEIKKIHTDSNQCDDARRQVTDMIRNLSATSEQNASSTEEMTAAMEQLNNTMSVLAGKADDLGNLASNLQESLEFFKL